MPLPDKSQLLILKRAGLQEDVAAFLLDRKARNLSARTVQFYQDQLSAFASFLLARGVTETEAITAAHLRAYLLHLAETRNPGGVHIAYRTAKTFLRWFAREYEPENWTNPIVKVAAPKIPDVLQDPANLQDLKAMLETANGRTFSDARDRAILLCLLDTGTRAAEFLALDVADVDNAGAVTIRQGKGGKRRMAFLGVKARKALAQYMRYRPNTGPLWLTDEGGRMAYAGLRSVMRRRAALADVPTPGLHSFRRLFALLCLRAGVDLVSLQRLLGHSDLSVIRRYLAETTADLQAAHERANPTDSL